MIKNNIFSILISLVILYLSLANAKTFEEIGFFDVPYLDKFVHFGLYFLFMSVIILEHRNSFSNTRQIIIVALNSCIFRRFNGADSDRIYRQPGKLMFLI